MLNNVENKNCVRVLVMNIVLKGRLKILTFSNIFNKIITFNINETTLLVDCDHITAF